MIQCQGCTCAGWLWEGEGGLGDHQPGVYVPLKALFLVLSCPEFFTSISKVTEELVRTYLDKYEEQQQQLAALFQLKSVLAPCIESLILLDRICWLMEQVTVE